MTGDLATPLNEYTARPFGTFGADEMSGMLNFLHFARQLLTWAVAAALAAAAGAATLAALLVLALSAWSGQLEWPDVWLMALNGAHFLLALVTAARALDRTIFNMSDSFWPRGPLFATLAAGLATTLLILGTTAFAQSPPATPGIWPLMFLMTNILTAASTAFAVTITPQLPSPASGANRWSVYALYFIHIVIVTHTAAVVVTLSIASETPENRTVFQLFVWIELAGALLVLAALNWRKTDHKLAVSGAVASALAFAVSCYHTLPFYGREMPAGGEFAVAATAVPLLLFLAILWRRRPLSETLT